MSSSKRLKTIINEGKQNEAISASKYELPSELKVNLKQGNGLIIFENKQQFDKITNLLMLETEKHIDSYFSQFDEEASVNEVNDIVDEDNFNPNLVFEAFESFHSITSLRVKLKVIEDEWLDNEELIGDNPSIYPISERSLSVANENGEYQIGKTIYRVENSGLVYEIKNQDYIALEDIRNAKGAKLKSANPNIIIHRSDAVNELKSTMGSCKAFVKRNKRKESGGHRMDMVLILGWNGTQSVATAKTKAFRKKRRFRKTSWGREWTSMSAQVGIVDFTNNCTEQRTY